MLIQETETPQTSARLQQTMRAWTERYPLPVIVNADDLGKSLAINAAIFALVDEGVVTSTTLMANGPAFDDALRGLRARAFKAVGVHLNLTEYKPLTAAPGIANLIDAAGDLAVSNRYAVPTPEVLRAVYDEWAAQIQAIVREGIVPTHMDSHRHSHTLPQFIPVTRRLQRDFGIRRVRRTRNIYPDWSLRSCAVWTLRGLRNCMLTLGAGSTTTDGFTDLPTYLGMSRLPRGIRTLEIMVHPGHPEHTREHEVLLSEECRRRLAQDRLISFLDLPA